MKEILWADTPMSEALILYLITSCWIWLMLDFTIGYYHDLKNKKK
jgi:hypothetical protein